MRAQSCAEQHDEARVVALVEVLDQIVRLVQLLKCVEIVVLGHGVVAEDGEEVGRVRLGDATQDQARCFQHGKVVKDGHDHRSV